MNQFKWTPEKTEQLRQLYPTASWDILEKEFPIKRHALHEYARKRGIKRLVCSQRKGDLTPLLEDTLITYYWIGFILADGCILNNGQLVVQLSEKDKDHLAKLATYLKTKVKQVRQTTSYKDNPKFRPEFVYRITVCDPKITNKIKDKFCIHQKKTYNPPDIESLNLTKDQAFAILIGFIDGDGCIYHKDRYIKIENHSSWSSVHKYFADIISKEFITTRTNINKRGYSGCYLKSGSINILQQFAELHNLPILERKWYVDKT